MGWRENLERMYEPVRGRWSWPKNHDFNGDGVFTISDIFQGIGWVFYAPGDLILYAFLSGKPASVEFLELTYRDYGGVFSTAVSVVTWLIVGGLSAAAFQSIGTMSRREKAFLFFLAAFGVVAVLYLVSR